MMMKWINGLGWLGFVLLAALLFTRGTRDETEDKQYLQSFQDNYNIYAVPIPENIDFAGEKPPLSDPEVVERLDKEMLVNTYWQSNTVLMFKRANRYFPVIEPILKQNGVPDDFKYLALIESGLTNVVSPAGAAGFWQFIKETGTEFGLEITEEVDERYHVEKATQAACNYLKAAKQKFGSWTLAAASYNMGMNGLARQIERQGESDYYNILLNTETSRYVLRLMAVKAIMEDPKMYGYNLRQKDLYQPLDYKTIEIDTTVKDFARFAKGFGISYKTLKFYNPWLRQNYLNNADSATYQLQLPMGAAIP